MLIARPRDNKTEQLLEKLSLKAFQSDSKARLIL